ISFKESKVLDHSGIEALQKVTKRYASLGKKVRLSYLSPDCKGLIDTAGNMVQLEVMEEAHYHVAID
ncbi:MAG: hypothetical protein NXH75_05240, partial [Halobacteriovoraceae bacterium]|nr:hypothetical protein [Halobacteriovoraceae bacterium]